MYHSQLTPSQKDNPVLRKISLNHGTHFQASHFPATSRSSQYLCFAEIVHLQMLSRLSFSNYFGQSFRKEQCIWIRTSFARTSETCNYLLFVPFPQTSKTFKYNGNGMHTYVRMYVTEYFLVVNIVVIVAQKQASKTHTFPLKI